MIEEGERTVNEIYEALAVFLKELRCDTDEREYLVEMEDLREAENQLRVKTKKYELLLKDFSKADREFMEEYLNAVDAAHFKEEQRAYYQGIMDGVQMLGELGVIKKSDNVDTLLKRLKK